ncbi:uncharacterized protein [Eleutherodactylus coqui]|uniref:uncharacterized protein n=1 Tax=Eleutherodactylus coqui TaxID=57060 RepID=UPI00346268FF
MEPTTRIRLRRANRRTLIALMLYMQGEESEKTDRASRRRRRYWVHPLLIERGTKGHFASLYQDLKNHPEKFVAFCRLPMEAFDRLLELLRRDLTYQDTHMRKAITAEERLLITLRFLATGESYASLHLQFRVGKSTITEIVRCTCSAIWQKLQPIVMPSPTEDTWQRVTAGFQDVAKFPNCIGAVDVDDLVKACCVLHNYLRDYRPEVDVEELAPAFDTVINWGAGCTAATAVQVREHFTDYFLSHEGTVPWQFSCVGGVQP